MNYYSKQREQILEVLKNTYSHPTAQELYALVHKNHPTISKSTVYRNINILVNNKQIIKISVVGRPDKYDYIHTNHNHAICNICGKVYDFEYNFNTQRIKDEIQKQTPIETFLDCVTIEGICKNCKSKSK